MTEPPSDDQLALPGLVRAQARKARVSAKPAKPPAEPSPIDPVAKVLVDVPLAHLDRPFDYLVPVTMAETAVPGARVKVRFAGRDVDGFVLERAEASDHQGRLSPLRRVVSAEPVLSAAIARLTASVAARYAGTRGDVLRLAVPARHATVEKRASTAAPPLVPSRWDGSGWDVYDRGADLLDRLRHGAAPRAVWSALPGEDWAARLAEAAAATYSSGRGSVLCVPDQRDLARLDEALTDRLGAGHHVLLTAEAGPSARYRSFLAVSRGAVRVVAGTRSAAFAPVHDLGLVALWDDGDDLYAEPRAPYPHTREVLLQRAHDEECAAIVGGHARTVEAAYLLHTAWAVEVAGSRATVRDRVAVTVTGASDQALARDPMAATTRIPSEAYAAVRDALATGPVLLQTPRSGYSSGLACDRCRTPARCTRCQGPLAFPGPGQPPTCRWCGTAEPAWACAECGNRGLRAPVLGDRRTAEEVGRAFPSVPVRTSAGDHVLDAVPGEPSIVVATPGAEPHAPGGYACVLLLDTWLMLSRADLRSEEEALRRWLNAASLVRPPAEGGRVVVVGESRMPVLQALVRWDPAGFAVREMETRRSAHLPPASRMATVTGPADVLEEVVAQLSLPEACEILGPVPVTVPVTVTPGPGTDEPQHRVVLRVPRAQGAALSRALVEVQGARSAKKLPPVRVQVDPVELD